MFRIKTDIRQFNCETQEKVEKLIRSWVIRPTDLMLDEAQQTWSPIGDHEDFAPLFEQLRDSSEVELSEPSSSEDEDDDADAVVEAITGGQGAASAQILSGHGMLKLRALAAEEESAQQEEEAPLPIPVAPEGVEPVAASDEPTIMTERTADLLGVLDEEEEEAPLPVPVAPEGVEGVAASDEATQIFERDEEEEEGEESAQDDVASPATSDESSDASYELEELSSPEQGDEESEPRLGRHDLPEELFLTNEISRSELVSPLEPMMDDLRDADSSVADDEDTEAWEVTQQIESPLGEHADDDALPMPEEPAEGIEVALSEAAESDIHSEWENMMELDELRETDEFDLGDHTDGLASSSESSEPEEDIRETIELDSPVSKEAVESEPEKAPGGISDKVIVDMSEVSESSEAEPDERGIGLDDTADFKTDEIFDSDTAPPPSIEDDETLDEFTPEIPEDAHHVIAESDDIDDVTDVPLDGQPLIPPQDFISEGYAMPLPFAITPSARDLELGVRRSTASEQEKDIMFPRPKPKKLGELTSRRYGYGDAPRVQSPGSSEPSAPPKDYSRIVAIIVLLLVVLIIASLIIIFD